MHEANPTIYRVPADYMSIIESVTSDGENGSHFGFELVLSRSIQTYAKVLYITRREYIQV